MSTVRTVGADPACVEFLPAAIEIEATPPRRLGRAVLWVAILLCVVAGIWSAVSQVDVVAVAPARLIPGGQVKRIQSRLGGTVGAIRVAEGARVRAGQVVIELDRTLAQSDRARISVELAAAAQELAQQRAFVAGITAGDVRPGRSRAPLDPAAGSLPAAWLAVLAEATEGHRSRMRQLDRAAARRRAELQASRDQLDRLRRTLPLVSERATAMLKLAGSGLIARLSALEAEERRIAVSQELAATEAGVRASEAALEEITEERRAVRAEVLTTAHARIAELESRIAMLQQDGIKAGRLTEESALVAPVDGELQQLAVHTLGGVVQPGETLAIVVPRGPALEVEALALNRDIGFIAPGQPAVIKIEAFPFTRHGTLRGIVASIAADAVQHERLGPVYPVRLLVTGNDLRADGHAVRLSSGMAASAEIRTGRRRVIDYLLSPLARTVDESLRER